MFRVNMGPMMDERANNERPEEESREATRRDEGEVRNARSWVNWQSVLYLVVVGWICAILVPLTSLWWIIPVLAVAAPLAYAALDRPRATSVKPDKKNMERELLDALAERAEITPTTAAMNTSLTVDEASKMLEELARKGHLELRIEEGVMAYALTERDRRGLPEKLSAPEPGGETPQPLADPLSEREMEVLALLSSGRTNAEIANDLFVALGTVKAHVNNIYRKLGAKNRAEALARAREIKLLP